MRLSGGKQTGAAYISFVLFLSCLGPSIGIGRVGREIACEKTCEVACEVACEVPCEVPCGLEGEVTLNRLGQVNPAGMQFEKIISS